MSKNHKYCVVSVIKIGDITLEDGITPEMVGISDNRCTECEIKYGALRDMNAFYSQFVDVTGAGFNDLMAECEYKSDKFVEKMFLIKPAIVMNDEAISPHLIQKVEEKCMKIGIDKMSKVNRFGVLWQAKKQELNLFEYNGDLKKKVSELKKLSEEHKANQ
jgi:hypothetical protein